jgi:vacuolar-type H+-ATPase subunit F/Vma7
VELSLRVLCSPEIAPGFALAGLAVDEARGAATAAARLRDLAARPEVGIVLVEERLHSGLPAELRERLARRAFPIVMPFPGPRWDAQSLAEDYVLEILRRAIGYRVQAR